MRMWLVNYVANLWRRAYDGDSTLLWRLYLLNADRLSANEYEEYQKVR